MAPTSKISANSTTKSGIRTQSGWAFILPSGDFYRWETADGQNLVLSEQRRLASLDPTYYTNPTLLHDGTDTRTLPQIAFDLDQDLGLRFAGGYFENFGGLGHKWMLGNDQTWYYVTSSGEVYRWGGSSTVDGNQFVGDMLLTTLDAPYFADPTLLHDAPPLTNPVTTEEIAYDLDLRLGLYTTGDYFESYFGLGYKWMLSGSGTWYYLTQSGDVYRWSGSTTLSGSHFVGDQLVASLDATFHADPTKLHEAPVQSSTDASGNVASVIDAFGLQHLLLTPDAAFTGKLRIFVYATSARDSDNQMIDVDVV